MDCTIHTEVGTICPECANDTTRARTRRPSRLAGKSVTTWILGITTVVSLLAMVFPQIQSTLLYAPVLSSSEPWRLLTVALVHGGFLHLALNMFSLYIVGSPVEQALGAGRYLVLYAASAIGGSLFVLLWALFDPQGLLTATVGASGALFGLFAAVYVLQKSVGADTRSITVLLAVNLVYGFIVSNVSWQAHVGGLLVGAFVTWLLVRLGRPRAGKTHKQQQQTTVIASVLVFVALIAINYGLFWMLTFVYG